MVFTSNGKVKGTKFLHDYKNRLVKYSSLDSTEYRSLNSTVFYNKKGYKTKFASITKSGDTILMTKYEYDKDGMVKRQEVYRDNKLSFVRTYENIYDSMGNVIERNAYEDGELKRKSLFYLTY